MKMNSTHTPPPPPIGLGSVVEVLRDGTRGVVVRVSTQAPGSPCRSAAVVKLSSGPRVTFWLEELIPLGTPTDPLDRLFAQAGPEIVVGQIP